MAKWDEKKVADIIIDKYDTFNKTKRDQWMWFRGLRTFAGKGESLYAGDTILRGDLYSEINEYYSERYIDLFIINKFKPYKRIAYEIKVSIGDFKKEIENPIKSSAGKRLSNEFWFAAPEGILKSIDIPEDCGFLEVTRDHKMNMIKRAPVFEADEFPIEFAVSLLGQKWKGKLNV